jgi:hypothetical protein
VDAFLVKPLSAQGLVDVILQIANRWKLACSGGAHRGAG